MEESILREYEIYLDECRDNKKTPLPFVEWKVYYDKGELYLLD